MVSNVQQDIFENLWRRSLSSGVRGPHFDMLRVSGEILVCRQMRPRRGQLGFHEVIFAIAKTESQISYTRVIDAFAKAMKICCGVDDALERVGQFHVDLSAAAAAMHQSVLPHALLALDWAHFAPPDKVNKV